MSDAERVVQDYLRNSTLFARYTLAARTRDETYDVDSQPQEPQGYTHVTFTNNRFSRRPLK